MKVTPTDHGLLFAEEELPLHHRLLILLLGLSMFVMPCAVLLHVNGTESLGTLLVASLFVVLPTCMGLFLVKVGLAMPRQVCFDARRRQIEHRKRGLLGLRVETLSFDRVERVELVRQKMMDDPDLIGLVMSLHGRQPVKLGFYDSAEQAERWQQRLQALLST